MKGIVLLCASGCLTAGTISQANGQQRPTAKQTETDTTYVKPYTREVTARLFLSQKYTGLRVPGTSTVPDFRYRPNTTINFGIGATYRSFTVNLAYGFPGLNGDGSERGKTRYVDLQAHLYGRKVVIDLFGQFYKGYYLSPKDYISGFPGYYIRPDVRIRMVGGSAYYVFNHRKFSYRAGFIQSEWQSKSAGTFLLGGDVYYGVVNSDSLLIPSEIAHQFPQGQVKRFRFFNIGPGGGYAYTFVYKKNWFVTGSLTVNIPIDFVKESTLTEEKNKISFSPNFMARLAVGYNSRRWIYTASVVNSMVSADGAYNEGVYRISTGNYRLTAARRFTLSRKTKKAIKPVEKILPLPDK